MRNKKWMAAEPTEEVTKEKETIRNKVNKELNKADTKTNHKGCPYEQ